MCRPEIFDRRHDSLAAGDAAMHSLYQVCGVRSMVTVLIMPDSSRIGSYLRLLARGLGHRLRDSDFERQPLVNAPQTIRFTLRFWSCKIFSESRV